ncbi:MAG: TIGR04086 family membrane protein [Ruminococcus sp.]|nr:TIGR04086 family membrane protein [Ruminococcus sp.]
MKSLTIEFNKFKFIKGLVVGLILGELVLLILLSITSVIMTSTGILDNVVLEIILTIICGISAYVSGFACSKIAGIKGIINGSVSGLLFFVIIFCAGMIAMDGTVTLFTFLKFIACLLGGTVGGIIGINKKEKLIK